MNIRKRILITRIIFSALLLIGIIIHIIISCFFNGIFIAFWYMVDVILLMPFMASLLMSYKEYVYNEQKIAVYAGWYHHYIKVDGTILDEHNTLVSHTAIYLSCILDDGAVADVTISLMNRITLKINNRMYNCVNN